MIENARALGGRVVTLGDRQGCVIHPTIIIEPARDARVIREEVCGPVVVIMRAENIDDSIELANDRPFGLQGSCFTSSLATAMRMSEDVRVGSLWINDASRFGSTTMRLEA